MDALLPDQRGRPLRDLRISVIDRCNFRCPYCMPVERFGGPAAFLPRAEWLAPDEIERIARVFVGLGVRKLRLTGGEPLLRAELTEIVARLARIDSVEDLALTTNGALLARHAPALRAAGLHRLTISLDALDPNVFATMSGGHGDVAVVLDGFAAAERAGFARIKINCVVQRGVNEDEVLPLVERFRGTPHVLRFIEYMDVGTCNAWRRAEVVDSEELLARIAARWPLQPVRRAQRGEVAERYRFVDGQGEIGFVSSVSAPFCGDCTRARVSADGELFTCLFASRGMPLRPLLAGDDDALVAALSARWRARGDRYSELRAEREREAAGRVEMFRMGG
jgi:cyclic pyranopterin phosphate synthase